MGFVIGSSTGSPLPQEALRRIVEAVDSWRGQSQAFVVLNDTPPYEIASVHLTEGDAQAAVGAETGLTYCGPVTTRAASSNFYTLLKPIGCHPLVPLEEPASTVVFLDANETELARFTANPLGDRPPNPESDLDAVFLTPSGVDKFLIPYLTRVFGADYAAARRGEWITD